MEFQADCRGLGGVCFRNYLYNSMQGRVGMLEDTAFVSLRQGHWLENKIVQ